MLIVDSGPLVAMLDAKDRHHEACTALFQRFRGPIVVLAPIVTEVAYFLQIEPGPAVEAAFFDALTRGGDHRVSAGGGWARESHVPACPGPRPTGLGRRGHPDPG
jgi:predicted nucleic acid-binding protein